MKKIIAMVFSCVFASVFVANSYGEESNCTPEKYDGTKECFDAFKAKYSKKDWPDPETIAYYDPAGKGDKVIRYAHWLPSVEKKGVVVHFNGRTEFIEKNIYTYKDLLDRGFEVWAFDWRGQGFSKRQLTAEKQKHDIDSFDTYLKDVIYFIDNVAHINKDTKGTVLLAHSMGGQIALRYLLEYPDTFKYAVLSSPLLRVPKDAWGVRLLNPIKIGLGGGSWCVWEKPDFWSSYFIKRNSCELMASDKIIEDKELDPKTETKNYSNDLKKDAEIDCLIETSINDDTDKSDLRLACPTSNWLHAAFDSTDIVMDIVKKDTTKLETPTLIVRAVPDHAVDNDGQTEFCTLAKNCKIFDVRIVDGVQTGHELLIEKEPIRKKFFEYFDKFVHIKNQPD